MRQLYVASQKELIMVLRMAIPGTNLSPYPHATFAAMVERIDRNVAQVVHKLDELGLSEKYCNHFWPQTMVRTKKVGQIPWFFW